MAHDHGNSIIMCCRPEVLYSEALYEVDAIAFPQSLAPPKLAPPCFSYNVLKLHS